MSNRSATQTQALFPVSGPQVETVDPAVIIAKLQLELAEQKAQNEKLTVANEALTADVVRLKELTLRDPLTGLYNRRQFNQQLDEEVGRIRRGLTTTMSLLFVDVDDFKKVNDKHGHKKGDDVLRRVARTLMDPRRRGDTVARYGGEEFVIIAPNTDSDGAAALAQRLCDKIAAIRLDLDSGEELRLTVSVGVATYRPDTDALDPTKLVDRSNTAERLAKVQGKNRVVVNRSGSVPPAIKVAKK